MGTKRTGDDCYDKAGRDEPLFVLRAQDELAPDAVRTWAGSLFRRTSALPKEQRPERKIQEALDLADAMEAWQREHGCKVPD